ncbi:MAG: zf-TFIIB domain-containing protein [Bauldia sp.]
MPLLMCPNDNLPMQSISRSGVEFDMCPTCRGVWLDRGELEKIIAEVQAAMPAAPMGESPVPGGSPGFGQQPYPPDYGQQPGYDPRYRRHDDDDDDRYDDDRRGGRRRRGFSLFDIFD